ncbi:MAG: helix-turn-helix domain-containing protein [Roseburia sp.]|nr:helix-turn-helix domain-containing protein [Roseburia sp.]
MDKADIINRIGYIRTRARLTQKALSVALELNPNYINRLESKKDFLPSLEVLLRIIEVCGSTPEEFFYHDISAYEHDKAVSDKIKSLPDDVKEFVLDYDPELMQMFTTINRKFVKKE